MKKRNIIAVALAIALLATMLGVLAACGEKTQGEIPTPIAQYDEGERVVSWLPIADVEYYEVSVDGTAVLVAPKEVDMGENMPRRIIYALTGELNKGFHTVTVTAVIGDKKSAASPSINFYIGENTLDKPTFTVNADYTISVNNAANITGLIYTVEVNGTEKDIVYAEGIDISDMVTDGFNSVRIKAKDHFGKYAESEYSDTVTFSYVSPVKADAPKALEWKDYDIYFEPVDGIKDYILTLNGVEYDVTIGDPTVNKAYVNVINTIVFYKFVEDGTVVELENHTAYYEYLSSIADKMEFGLRAVSPYGAEYDSDTATLETAWEPFVIENNRIGVVVNEGRTPEDRNALIGLVSGDNDDIVIFNATVNGTEVEVVNGYIDLSAFAEAENTIVVSAESRYPKLFDVSKIEEVTYKYTTEVAEITDIRAQGDKIVWNTVGNAESYDVTINGSEIRGYFKESLPYEVYSQYAASGTENAGKYDIKIRANYGAVHGDYSAVATLKTAAVSREGSWSNSFGDPRLEFEIYPDSRFNVDVEINGNTFTVAAGNYSDTQKTYDADTLYAASDNGKFVYTLQAKGNNDDYLDSQVTEKEITLARPITYTTSSDGKITFADYEGIKIYSYDGYYRTELFTAAQTGNAYDIDNYFTVNYGESQVIIERTAADGLKTYKTVTSSSLKRKNAVSASMTKNYSEYELSYSSAGYLATYEITLFKWDYDNEKLAKVESVTTMSTEYDVTSMVGKASEGYYRIGVRVLGNGDTMNSRYSYVKIGAAVAPAVRILQESDGSYLVITGLKSHQTYTVSGMNSSSYDTSFNGTDNGEKRIKISSLNSTSITVNTTVKYASGMDYVKAPEAVELNNVKTISLGVDATKVNVTLPSAIYTAYNGEKLLTLLPDVQAAQGYVFSGWEYTYSAYGSYSAVTDSTTINSSSYTIYVRAIFTQAV